MTAIFVLRHADRAVGADSLSDAGKRRAQSLAGMLADTGVSVAYCSDARRTYETLAPLKQRLGDSLTIHEVSAADPGGTNAHVQSVVAAIKALPSDTVAVAVSHSNTVRQIIEGLGGGSDAKIAETEFDKLFLLVRCADGQNTLLRLHY